MIGERERERNEEEKEELLKRMKRREGPTCVRM
jgi:hypothetical protein